MRTQEWLILLAFSVLSSTFAAEPPAIKALTDAKPKPTVFKAASQTKPLVIRTEKEAAEHFLDASLAALKKQVDLKKQIVLVFAWQGSGQDRLSHSVAESYPEQVTFKYTHGFSRDLRPHIHVYALRSNVKWTAK